MPHLKSGVSMADYVLPEVREGTNLELLHFPTRMQAFVFRNWETVSKEQIAKVLRVDVSVIEKIAADMGLPEQSDLSQWMTRGYITIIKQNWHILPYSQLLELLDWNEEYLAYVLKEDDFLSIKLGSYKFDCPPVVYEELNEEQIKETAEIKKTITEVWRNKTAPAFDFFRGERKQIKINPNVTGIFLSNDWGVKDESGFDRATRFAELFKNEVMTDWGISLSGNKKFITLKSAKLSGTEESHKIEVTEDGITVSANSGIGLLRGLMFLCDTMRSVSSPSLPVGTKERHARFETRMIYSYHGLYGSVFDESPELSFSEDIMLEYARLGVNGIWMQGVLYKLVEFPFAPEISKGYEKRQENLKKIIDMAANYGIKVYLYLNEPRTMPLSFFDEHPELKGHSTDKAAYMCTSTPEVQKYLRDSVTELCTVAKGLGGFFTITASENATSCYSHRWWGKDINCPRCTKRTPAQIFAEVNKIIADAARSVDSSIRTVAWSWSWKGIEGFDFDEIMKEMPEYVSLMSNSEEELPFTIGGVSSNVRDYTMSVPAPSDIAKNFWKKARESGHGVMAKVQINNTWECSVVPYIPVFGIVKGHVERLMNAGVNNIMLSWTLGGAPAPNIKIASQYFFDDDTQMDMLNVLYGENAETVKTAAPLLDAAFTEYPFDIHVIYFGPHFTGSVNLLYKEKTGIPATMTGFPYDDLDKWRAIYPRDVYENQLRLLSSKWKDGLDALENMRGTELYGITETCYDIFRSCYNQVRYVQLQEEGKYSDMIKILREEEKLALNMYEHALADAKLGYEAANHYVYTPQMCLEKVLNCRKLIREFENM